MKFSPLKLLYIFPKNRLVIHKPLKTQRESRTRWYSLFERFDRWLSGSFNCIKCGKRMYLMSFGYGETICPHCYTGEEDFIFLDSGYWLNRLISKFIKQGTRPQKLEDFDEIILEHVQREDYEIIH